MKRENQFMVLCNLTRMKQVTLYVMLEELLEGY